MNKTRAWVSKKAVTKVKKKKKNLTRTDKNTPLKGK